MSQVMTERRQRRSADSAPQPPAVTADGDEKDGRPGWRRRAVTLGFPLIAIAFALTFAWHVNAIGLNQTTGVPAGLIVVTLLLAIAAVWGDVRAWRGESLAARTQNSGQAASQLVALEGDPAHTPTDAQLAEAVSSPPTLAAPQRIPASVRSVVSRLRRLPPGLVTVLALGCFVAVLPVLGFIVSGLAFGLTTMILLGYRLLVRGSLALVIVVFALWALFKYLFLLPLPGGTVHIG